MRRDPLWLYALAAGIGLTIGVIDVSPAFATDDNAPAVLMVAVPAFLFGLAHPRHAWRWALLVGLGVPLCHLVGLAVGYHAPYPVQPNVGATFLALVPAFVAAYLGVAVRVALAAGSAGETA
jgi:NO-binding membrane sensor protein with MHYT domain